MLSVARHPRRFSFVTDELPRRGAAGHLAYNHALITHLRESGHRVDLFLTRPRLPSPVMRFDEDYGIRGPRLLRFGPLLVAGEMRAVASSLARRMFPSLLGRARRRRVNDVVLGAEITAAEIAWIAPRIAADRRTTILIDTVFRARLLDHPALAGMRSIIITHDLFHRRHAALRLAGYRVAPAQLSRADEAALLNRADALVAIQPEEARILAGMCPDRRVFSVPMPATPAPRPPDVARHPERLVFIGSDNLPNLDGLRWFLAEIWPGLRAVRPHIELDLVGDCGAMIGPLPSGVRRLGRVADLAPVLHAASLAIAPLRAGSGLKVKLLDYARHGLWTVATSEAVAGLAPDDRLPVYIADTAASFGATILASLTGSAADEDALVYVDRNYCAARVFAPLDEMLTD